MADWKSTASCLAHMVAEVAAETLWPTRCALCDTPGSVLCEHCTSALVPVDWWRACRRCGAPYGFVQCTLCNSLMLDLMGREQLPFAGCASAVMFDNDSGRIARVFKDQDEQRLSQVMASMMVRALSPDWRFDAVTFVPATLPAMRYRGFDHAQLIAKEVARMIGVPCRSTLYRPKVRDQRALSAAQRRENMQGRFKAKDPCEVRRALLVDDVFTTGSTLCSACDALLAAGCDAVYCLTFARV